MSSNAPQNYVYAVMEIDSYIDCNCTSRKKGHGLCDCSIIHNVTTYSTYLTKEEADNYAQNRGGMVVVEIPLPERY